MGLGGLGVPPPPPPGRLLRAPAFEFRHRRPFYIRTGFFLSAPGLGSVRNERRGSSCSVGGTGVLINCRVPVAAGRDLRDWSLSPSLFLLFHFSLPSLAVKLGSPAERRNFLFSFLFSGRAGPRDAPIDACSPAVKNSSG